jgi:putative zinc finger/helix-turn-helix protein, YgiT family
MNPISKGERAMNSHIEKRNQTFKVRDTEITVLADARVDDETEEIIFDHQLDNQAINQAFEQYRIKNGLISSKDIIDFRKQYNLSQRSLAKLLSIGSATIARYEKGALPSESLSNLLKQFIVDDGAFIQFFNQNKNNLTNEDSQKVESVLDGMKQKIKTDSVLKAYTLRNENNTATINDGFKKFDFNKFKNMVIFLISHGTSLSKTRLNKLLFYCDFIFFSENAVSMSGAIYMHDHYGPVPSDFDLLYTVLRDQNVIDARPFSDGHGEELLTDESFDDNYFSKQELSTLKRVAKKFKDYNAKMITEYSHKEKAYQETESKSIISYKYAFELND